MSIKHGGSGSAEVGTLVNRGDVDATLEANLPSNPSDGDAHRVSVGGTFENSSLITPANYVFTTNDLIIWVDSISKWKAQESGDDRLRTTANLSDLDNTTTSRTNLDVPSNAEAVSNSIKYSIALG
jgi:hypothetical protein